MCLPLSFLGLLTFSHNCLQDQRNAHHQCTAYYVEPQVRHQIKIPNSDHDKLSDQSGNEYGLAFYIADKEGE